MNRSDHPYQLIICGRRWCEESEPNEPNNERLKQAIANELGVSADEVHGKLMDIAGQTFRIECQGCQRECHRSPIVTIVTKERFDAPAKVTSLESLKEQVGQVLDGTWNFPDVPPEDKE